MADDVPLQQKELYPRCNSPTPACRTCTSPHHTGMSGLEVAVFFIFGLLGIGVFIGSLFGLYEFLRLALYLPLQESFEALEASGQLQIISASWATSIVGTLYLFLPGIFAGATFGRKAWLFLHRRYQDRPHREQPFLLFLLYNWQFLIVLAAALGALVHAIILGLLRVDEHVCHLLLPFTTRRAAKIVSIWVCQLVLASPIVPIERFCACHGGLDNLIHNPPGGVLTTWTSRTICAVWLLVVWSVELMLLYIYLRLHVLVAWVFGGLVPSAAILTVMFPTSFAASIFVLWDHVKWWPWRIYGAAMGISLGLTTFTWYYVVAAAELRSLLSPFVAAKWPAFLSQNMIDFMFSVLILLINPASVFLSLLVMYSRKNSSPDIRLGKYTDP